MTDEIDEVADDDFNPQIVRKTHKKAINRRHRFIGADKDLVLDQVAILVAVRYTNSQIARILGVSRGQVKEFKAMPTVQKKIEVTTKTLQSGAMELGISYLIESVQAIHHVMRTAKDEAMILRAAESLLDRFGIPKASRSESKRTEEHEFRTPVGGTTSLDLVEAFKGSPPEIQEQAADLYAMFEEGVKGLMEKQQAIVEDESETEITDED